MNRLVFLVLLLLLLLALPLAARAAPPADNGTVEATATPPPEDAQASAETTDALSNALGTLAVYAAIVAALAAGTEVITDLLRPFFGLKRQPQVMETFEQMKEWLPQTLKEMGADPQAQAQLQGYLNELDSTVKQVGTEVSGEKIAETVQKWALGAIKSGSAQLDTKLGELEAQLRDELNLKGAELDGVKDTVKQCALAIFAALESGEELLQKLKTLLADLNVPAAQIDAAVGKSLELMNTLVDDEQIKQELRALLTGLNVPPNQIDEAVEQVRELLKALKGAPGVQDVIKLASNLDSFDTVLRAVESQRAGDAGYLRLIWRALRDWKGILPRLILPGQGRYQTLIDKGGWRAQVGGFLRRILPDDADSAKRWAGIRQRGLLGHLLYYLEQGWNGLRDGVFGSIVEKDSLSTLLTPENAAQVILDLDRHHHLTEARRKRLLRFVTVFIGIALAITLRIDSLQLLGSIVAGHLPDVLYCAETDEFLTLEQMQNYYFAADERKEETWSCEKLTAVTEKPDWDGKLWKPWDVESWKGFGRWLLFWVVIATPGMLLTGLAASAGSAFWHDQLDRLRAAKQVTEQVTTVVGQIQGTQQEGK